MGKIVEVIFRDRIGSYVRGQVATIDSDTPFFRALINGGKAEVVNPPDWSFDGESVGQPSESSELDTVPSKRRPRKKSEKSPGPVTEHGAEGYGESVEFVSDRDNSDSGASASEDSVGRPEYSGDPERYPGAIQ